MVFRIDSDCLVALAQVYRNSSDWSVRSTTGRRVALTQTTPLGDSTITRLRYFSYDADGHILTRRDGTLDGSTFTETANSRQHYAYADGQQVATLGEDGTIDAATQLTAFDSSDLGTEPALVLEGDTLQSIAQRVYGNGNLWYVLAAANAVTDADLVAGTTLKAPAVKTTANDANTFKPYDASKIEGPTTPSLPYISAPSQHGCDAMAMVVRLFVAVAVAFGQVYVAAAYATIGEAAAQSVEIQDGYREGYDWGQVALSGLTAGAGAGGAGSGIENGFVHGAVMAAASNLASYALHKALGEEAHFSLRGLVSDTLAGGIAEGVLGRAPTLNGTAVGGNITSSASFSWTAVAAAATSVLRQGISYGVHQAIEGHATWNNGQVLANAATDAAVAMVGKVRTDEQKAKEAQQFYETAKANGNAFGVPAMADTPFGDPADPFSAQHAAQAWAGYASGANSYDPFDPTQAAAMLPATRAPQSYIVQSGDSLSKILGTSDPTRIGLAIAQNGLTSTTIRPGQELVLGDLSGYSDDQLAQLQALGQQALDGDNARLAALRAEAERALHPDFSNVVGSVSTVPDANWMNGYGVGVTESGWRMEGTSDVASPAPGYDQFGRRVPVWAGGPASSHSESASKAAYYGGRFLKGAASVITEPVLMTADLLRIGYSVTATELTGELHEVSMWSSMGKAAENGATTWDLLPRAVLGSNPVTGVGMFSYDMTTAALNGDWGGMAEGAGGLIGGIGLTQVGLRYLPAEPGAQFGLARLGTKATSDVVDVGGVSNGLLPPLPSDQVVNFIGLPTPREFSAGELSRVFEAGNRKAPFNGRYWGEQIPASEADWRGPYAVLKGWGNAGTDLATLQSPSTWAWYGNTAAQAVPGRWSSWQFGDYVFGWYQPGGRPQAMIPNASNLITPVDVRVSPTPWMKP